ncbi:CGLD17 [Auxenochlorella protothecoides x Auxenochlorella symbiontica]
MHARAFRAAAARFSRAFVPVWHAGTRPGTHVRHVSYPARSLDGTVADLESAWEREALLRTLGERLAPLRALARANALATAADAELAAAGLTRGALEEILRLRGPGPAALSDIRRAALRALGGEASLVALEGVSSQAVEVDETAASEAGPSVAGAGRPRTGGPGLSGPAVSRITASEARPGRVTATEAELGEAAVASKRPPPHASAQSATPPPRAGQPLEEALARVGLPAWTAAEGMHRLRCPRCGGGSDAESSLVVTSDAGAGTAAWLCHRATCGWSGRAGGPARAPSARGGEHGAGDGALRAPSARRRPPAPAVRPRVDFRPLTPEMLAFFDARGISREALERNGVAAETLHVPGGAGEAAVIAFPYHRAGRLVNVKYRTLDKRFWQVRGAEKVLYGLDQLVFDGPAGGDVVIVEGEMDKLAMESAGLGNVVSVPDGAPARVRDGDLPPAEDDTKFSYLWNCKQYLDQAQRVIVATDNDAPGEALAEELARRLGRERCWRVRWPVAREDHELAARGAGLDALPAAPDEGPGEGSAADGDAAPGGAWYRKDANEVLMRDGAAMLRAMVEGAEPLPIRGLLRFHEYYDDILRHYYLDPRTGQAASTGWPALDAFYKVIPGELTIVTGVPNSGKSEWIDALLCNLAFVHGWTFAMCSMEKKAMDHARQLVEKYTGRPFFDLPYARNSTRMSLEELNEGLDWVDDRFHLVRYEDDALPSVDWVLDVAKAAVYRYGIRGLVIDPYNELDHQRPGNMSETEYVSQMLTKIKRFAQVSGVHVWFVAHPRQLQQWRGEAPNLYDISGSAHFINKADNGIVVHRNREPGAENAAEVQILVRKVRNKVAGTLGEAVLEYDRVNGRYIDPGAVGASAPQTSARVGRTGAAAPA